MVGPRRLWDRLMDRIETLRIRSDGRVAGFGGCLAKFGVARPKFGVLRRRSVTHLCPS